MQQAVHPSDVTWTQREYGMHRGAVARIALWNWAVMFVGMGAYRVMTGDEWRREFILSALSASFYALFTTNIYSRARFAVTPLGIHHRTGLGQITDVAWADVVAIGPRFFWYPLPLGGTCLHLRQPHAGHTSWFQPRYRTWYSIEKIPLADFDPHWHAGEIGHALRRHAPWLGV